MDLKFAIIILLNFFLIANIEYECHSYEFIHSIDYPKRSFNVNTINKTVSHGKLMIYNLLHKKVEHKLKIQNSNQETKEPNNYKQLKLNRVCLGSFCMNNDEIKLYYQAQSDLKKKLERDEIERAKLFKNLKNDYRFKFLLDFNADRFF
jgi:hypothetical protein